MRAKVKQACPARDNKIKFDKLGEFRTSRSVPAMPIEAPPYLSCRFAADICPGPCDMSTVTVQDKGTSTVSGARENGTSTVPGGSARHSGRRNQSQFNASMPQTWEHGPGPDWSKTGVARLIY